MHGPDDPGGSAPAPGAPGSGTPGSPGPGVPGTPGATWRAASGNAGSGSSWSADGTNGTGGTFWPPAGGQAPYPAAPRPTPGRTRWPLSPKATAWAVAGLALLLILVGTGRITTAEIVLFCTIVPSIVLHEISHGVVALAFGDDTAKRAGRLTLNPLVHVDLLGTIVLPALMILAGFGWFGWAKPVPVDLSKLRSPRNQGVLVALAGPATNVALAVVAALLFRVLGGPASVTWDGQLPLWGEILLYGGLVNIWLAAFNLIPVPPLDGSALLERCLPAAWWPYYLRIRPYTLPILVALVFANYLFHLGLLTGLENTTLTWWGNLLGIRFA